MDLSQAPLTTRTGHANSTQSGFHISTIGRAATNLILGELDLQVYPIEHLAYVSGDIHDKLEEEVISGTDKDGSSYSIKVNSRNSIRAKWLPLGSNRLSPPNIRRGERVLLYQYGDNDEYFWTDMGMDGALRRLETVIYAFSNTQDESVKVLTPDNSYWFEVSTHKKHITLSTATNDTEPRAYKIQINTKEGAIVIADDLDNLFELDSNAHKWTLTNADKSIIVMEKKNIDIKADNVSIKSKSFNVESQSMSFKGSKYGVDASAAFKGSLTSNGINISDSHKHMYKDGITKGVMG